MKYFKITAIAAVLLFSACEGIKITPQYPDKPVQKDTTVTPPVDTTVTPPVDTTVIPPVDTTVIPPVDTTVTPPVDTTVFPPVSKTKYGWFELPVTNDADFDGVDDKDKDIYYAYHLANNKAGQTVRNFSVCYSGKHHCPIWIAAPRHSMYSAKNTNRSDAYQKDPDIPSGIQYHSKSTGGGCNKGHMLGSAERLGSSALNRQVFYYTNIAPQNSSTFNTGGGAWNNLEDHIDRFECADTLYEVIGCYFEKYTDAYGETCVPITISFGGRDDVTRPSMFYYVLLRTKSGNSHKSVTSCSASELECAAIVLRHNMDKGHKPQEKDIMTVAELEKITGYTYFPNVPNAPKTKVNKNFWL